MNLIKPIEIKPGLVITIDTLKWCDGWEFEHPSMILRPVIRCFETGANHEQMVEELCLDAISGLLHSEDFTETWGWRGYKLKVLRDRFREALKGKQFPKAGYVADRETVEFFEDEDGLNWRRKDYEI